MTTHLVPTKICHSRHNLSTTKVLITLHLSPEVNRNAVVLPIHLLSYVMISLILAFKSIIPLFPATFTLLACLLGSLVFSISLFKEMLLERNWKRGPGAISNSRLESIHKMAKFFGHAAREICIYYNFKIPKWAPRSKSCQKKYSLHTQAEWKY
uniref:Uncharacterized protein n=1 Tax=Rhizophora mucronata TaxID=61149 RepID=A0A2P2ITP2_RHIMU